MATIASMTLTDGVDATRVMTPITTRPAIWKDVDDVNLPEIGQTEVTVQAFRAKKNGVHRVRVTTKTPVMESTVGGAASGYVAAPAVAFILLAVTDYYLPQRASTAQKAMLRNMHISAMAPSTAPQVVLCIEQLIEPT